jgi:hypothetical protein
MIRSLADGRQPLTGVYGRLVRDLGVIPQGQRNSFATRPSWMQATNRLVTCRSDCVSASRFCKALFPVTHHCVSEGLVGNIQQGQVLAAEYGDVGQKELWEMHRFRTIALLLFLPIPMLLPAEVESKPPSYNLRVSIEPESRHHRCSRKRRVPPGRPCGIDLQVQSSRNPHHQETAGEWKGGKLRLRSDGEPTSAASIARRRCRCSSRTLSNPSPNGH